MKLHNKGFTLVELIVVITILAILATIGFVSMQGYTKSARESTRVSDIQTISKSLELVKIQDGFYPDPTDFFTVSYSGATAWKQGVFGDETRQKTKRISEVPLDPLTKSQYAYSTTNTRQEYEIGAISETNLAHIDVVPQTHAANSFFSYIKGNYNKKIISLQQGNILYVLGVPTIITTEIQDVTVLEVLNNQSFAVEGSQNLPGSYATMLAPGESHTGAVSFTPGSSTTTAPVLFEGTTMELSGVDGKITLGDNIQTYYGESNISDNGDYNDVEGITDGEEVEYINTLIQANVGGLDSSIVAVSETGGNSTTPIPVTACEVDYNIAANEYSGRYNSSYQSGYQGIPIRMSDGSIQVFGNASDGFSTIQNDVTSGVNKIFCTNNGYAALKTDGSVVTWGSSYNGGDSSTVSAQLSSGVNDIYSTNGTFAALKSDGSLVIWGNSYSSGDYAAVASQINSGVTAVYSTNNTFAALKNDGSVVTWGNNSYGGDSSTVSAQLSSGVTKIFSTSTAFAALKSDGSVVTWGNNGGDSSSVAAQLISGVVSIASTGNAFAALKSDGSVVTWGHASTGGDSSSVSAQLTSGVTEILGTGYGSFAALKSDGSVVTWGAFNASSVAPNLDSGVVSLSVTPQGRAFAALKNDGSVITWGIAGGGGDSSSVASEISSGVTKVYSSGGAFAALKSDGSVVTWGYASSGGDSSAVSTQLASGVVKIVSTQEAFAAFKNDGSIVTWGTLESGGAA